MRHRKDKQKDNHFDEATKGWGTNTISTRDGCCAVFVGIGTAEDYGLVESHVLGGVSAINQLQLVLRVIWEGPSIDGTANRAESRWVV